ncbi:MAG: hypothetical protein VB092_09305 [Oscillospiraceae bacterium]|nr:hypothetical protein [Oscillospiraceae bacterium]
MNTQNNSNRYPTSLNNSISRQQAQNNQYASYSTQQNEGKKGSAWALLVFPIIFLASVLPDGFGFILIPIAIALVIFVTVFAAVKAQKRAQGGASAGTIQRTPDGHLCDDNQHTSREPGAFDAIDEMEAGYRPASATSSTPTVTSASYGARTRRLTPEAFERKRAELHDLLNAGIISHAEYQQKLEEYRR